MRFLVVQHMQWEGPGRFLLDACRSAGVSLDMAYAWQGDLPPLDEGRGLIVLGGSPNVDEEEAFPYLVPLKRMMLDAINSGVKVLGFCLGHQLLGHILGANVGPNAIKSVGYKMAELTEKGAAHPAFKGLPGRFSTFKWHGQAVKMPFPQGSGLEILASSKECPVEAVSLGGNPRVVGLQFDNHADPTDAAAWLAADHEWATDGTGINGEKMLAKGRELEGEMRDWFGRFFENFLALG